MLSLVLLALVHVHAHTAVNVQPILQGNSLRLRVVYVSPVPVQLRARQGRRTTERLLAASTQLRELRIDLPLSQLDELQAFQGKTQLASPQFFLAAPVIERAAREHNSIGGPTPAGWVIPAGTYVIDRHLVIEATQIRVSAGAVFSFSGECSLTFKGATALEGSREKPVRFQGQASDFYLQVVQPSSARSRLRHVRVEGARRTPTALPTGVLTLYGGSFEVRELSLADITAEDALNGVHASLDVQGLEVRNVSSDAFDCDFCQLKLDEAHFTSVGGDGLDLSGSEFTVARTGVSGAGDKAFSIGEASTGMLRAIRVDDSNTAVAVKDGSRARVEGYQIRRTQQSFTKYTKKTWFPGPPELEVIP